MKRRTLDDDLRDLERTNIAVRDAAHRYDAVVATIVKRKEQPTMPTDLRAALRDAAEMLESYSEIGSIFI